MCSSLSRAICCPNDTHIARFATYSQSCAARGFGQFTLSLDLVFCAAISRVSFAFQSPRADRRFGPIAGFSLFCANGVGKTGGNHSLHAPTRANIPTSPYGSRRFKREWNTRNRRTEVRTNYRSDILHLRPGRKLSGKRLSPHGRSGRRRAATRNQGNWVAAIAGAMTWLRVSSSGGIGDAASVSVNAMGRRPGGGRRRSRNSSNTTSDEWPGSKGLGPFRLWLGLGASESTREKIPREAAG